MRPSGYLGDLGGLTAGRQLVLLDNRGTGDSAVPEDASTYRVDRLVADVEALRAHLGLRTMDLLAHSAGADLGVLYATRFPRRIRRLVLVTPSTCAVGLDPTDEEWYAEIRRRSAEPWYATALAALEAWDSGDEREKTRLAARPFFYDPWNDAAKAHAPAFPSVPVARKGYYADGAPGPDATRTAVRRLTAPVLVVSGEYDPAPTAQQTAAFAGLFPDGRSTSVPGAHFPWVTAPEEFASAVRTFLDS